MAKISKEKLTEVAERFCEDNKLILISVDSVLKGNRMEITTASQWFTDSKGKPIERKIIIAYGFQELEISGYNYNVIRNDNSDIGTDGISLYNFKDIRDARSWIRQDISRTLAMLNARENVDELKVGKDYWVYDNGNSVCIDWSIRKLPIQDNGEWTDPEYPVRYRVNVG